jgi:hypothetical protein
VSVSVSVCMYVCTYCVSVSVSVYVCGVSVSLRSYMFYVCLTPILARAQCIF